MFWQIFFHSPGLNTVDPIPVGSIYDKADGQKFCWTVSLDSKIYKRALCKVSYKFPLGKTSRKKKKFFLFLYNVQYTCSKSNIHSSL